MLNGVDTMELTPCSLLQIAEVQPNVCKVTKKAQSIKQNTPKTNAHHCSSAVSARVKQNETTTFCSVNYLIVSYVPFVSPLN